MQQINQFTIRGNLTRNAELQQTNAGVAFLKFSIANNRGWDDTNKKVYYFNCTLWGKRAEALANHLTKGVGVLLTGEMRPSQYEKDGVKHYSLDLNVKELEFVGGKPKDAPLTAEQAVVGAGGTVTGYTDTNADCYGEELPF